MKSDQSSLEILFPLSSKRAVLEVPPAMNALRKLRKILVPSCALLTLVLLGIPTPASGQTDVLVATGGVTSLTGGAPIYNGQYVLKQTDFGFLWLDTVALTGGLVQVEAKCGVGQPAPITNLYVVGDCNGITDILSTGNVVLARQLSGQCGAAKRGCNGPRDDGHVYFVFSLGTWALITDNGTGNEAGVSTQTADLQGRTWTVIQQDLSHFAWHTTGGGPVIPIASATYTNLTTTGGANYFGDSFRLTDRSQTATPITRVDWDVAYQNATYSPDAGVGQGTSITGYLPCDPAAGGNFATGAGCMTSVGSPAGTYSQTFAEKSTNSISQSLNTFVSPAISLVCPQVQIAGYSGATGTCARIGGTLSVLSGGSANAGGSQGNVNDPATRFDWTFSPGGAATGKNPIVPLGASSFTLTVTYPGGWQSSAQGSVVQTDLVPSFTLAPNPVLVNGVMTLTNTMQKGSAATLNSVDSAVDTTANPTAAFTQWLSCPGSGFCSANGTGTFAPTQQVGNYFLHLRYNYTGTSGAQSLIATQPFVVTDFRPAPQIDISPLPICFSSCQLQTGKAYSLKDSETIPISPHPGAQWDLISNSGTTSSVGTSTDAAVPISWTPTTACTGCTLKLTVSGASVTLPVSISAPSNPPPPTLSVSLSGPTSANVGQSVTFVAVASGGTGPISYTWNFGDNPLGGLQTGGATMSHTYSSAGNYSVLVNAAAGGATASKTWAISIVSSGPPPPSAGYSVSGADLNPLSGTYSALIGQTITFTANETNASSWAWNFGDGTTGSGKSVTHSYAAGGSRSVTLTVTGDGTQRVGTATATIPISITVPPFRAVIVPGVAKLDDGVNTWKTDVSVSNAGSTPMTISFSFYPLLANDAPNATDLRDLTYIGKSTLAPGGSFSANDVVWTWTTNNKGTLVIRYEDATSPPLVSTRVYFAPKENPGNVSYGSGLPAYDVDSSGSIRPQGFTSVVLDSAPSGMQTQTAQAVTGTITVNMTGTGSGTVTSSPAGINCPGTCSASFAAGPVTLSGAAATGSVFTGITGCAQIVLGQCIMDGSAGGTVTAKFDLQAGGGGGGDSQTLTVSRTGSGAGTITSSPAGISCPTTCSASYATGTAVVLTQTPASGSAFAGWTGACSGTGACTVTMSGPQSVSAVFTPISSAPALDQVLIGLRSNPAYRFGVTLFNSGNATGTFQLSATDESGAGVPIPDANGNPVGHRDFTIAPFQQVYLRDPDLGLTNPDRRYVLKAIRTSTTGNLLAAGTALDRHTNDLVQVTDDSQASAPDTSGLVSYWLAGVSRYDSSYGAHWRTDLRIFNRGSHARNLSFEYTFSRDSQTEHVARIGDAGGPSYITIAPGQLLTYDDVVASLMATDTRVDLSGSSAGILRIFYVDDGESSSRPLIIGSRNYDDQPTGTAGTQLAIYTSAQAATGSRLLYLPGVEDSARYATRIGVFTPDAGPVRGAMTAVAPDGSVVGSMGFTVGTGGLHYGQIDLTQLTNFVNPNKPVTIRISLDPSSTGRVCAYAFTVDKFSLDTNFIQGLPQ